MRHMRNPEKILNILVENSQKENYQYERLYRNLYNEEFYVIAYGQIYANQGNMTQGTDGKTIDGMSLERIQKIIEKIKNESYQPNPAKRVYIPKKNGKKRPLGIPSFDDKLVQQVLKMILESIYENKFQTTSHGFRPNKSCHSALNQIQLTFSDVKWFIEGDIKGFFDNIDHETLINILRKTIKDEKFIRLIWKFLRAGYMENWKYNNTYSGTPQGGIISPILANIYLNELDEYIKEYKKEFDKGKYREQNKDYRAVCCAKWYYRKKLNERHDELSQEERDNIRLKLKEYDQKLRSMKCKNPMDENYKRIQYVRYADDFLVGVIGSKQDAKIIKKDIKEFLNSKLKLELSDEKTLITNGKDSAKFLGYEVFVDKSRRLRKRKDGKMTTVSGAIKLQVPKEAWVGKLLQLEVLNRDSMQGNDWWKAKCRSSIINNEDLEIVDWYNSELRGMYNYYKLANNVSVLNHFHEIMEQSLIKTLCGKYRETSRRKILDKYLIEGNIGVRFKDKNGRTKIRYLVEKSYTRQKFSNKNVNENIDEYHKLTHLGRTALTDRLRANTCERCGSHQNIEVHHVRKLKDLKGKKRLGKNHDSKTKKNNDIMQKMPS